MPFAQRMTTHHPILWRPALPLDEGGSTRDTSHPPPARRAPCPGCASLHPAPTVGVLQGRAHALGELRSSERPAKSRQHRVQESSQRLLRHPVIAHPPDLPFCTPRGTSNEDRHVRRRQEILRPMHAPGSGQRPVFPDRGLHLPPIQISHAGLDRHQGRRQRLSLGTSHVGDGRSEGAGRAYSERWGRRSRKADTRRHEIRGPEGIGRLGGVARDASWTESRGRIRAFPPTEHSLARRRRTARAVLSPRPSVLKHRGRSEEGGSVQGSNR
jgi:hypothetical protein